MTTRKPRDMAQKWRAYKNFARFYKNPFGFVYWKLQPLHNQNRIRFMWVLLVFHLYSSFLLWIMIKNSKLIGLIISFREGKNDGTLEIQIG